MHDFLRAALARVVAATCCLCAAAAATNALAASADAYPSKPVRFINTQNPGASVDTISRVLATRMSEELGEQIVVDNRAGAGGLIALEIVAQAAPDGYTLLAAATGAQVITPHIFKKINYHPLKDFTPISLYAITHNLLVVNPSLPVKSVKDLIAYAKANPGKLNMANAGAGFQSHLAGVLLTHMTGMDVVHIPYKGGGASVLAVMTNESQVTIGPAPAMLTHVRAGRLRELATGGERRTPLMPDLPTMIEAGVPGYVSTGWIGLSAPKNLPKEIVDKLHATLAKVVNMPATREAFENQGADAVTSTPAEFARFIREEYERFGQAVRLANLKVE